MIINPTLLELVAIDACGDARVAINKAVAGMTCASHAAELIGCTAARNITPTDDWAQPVSDSRLTAWRQWVAEVAMQFWEDAKRRRIIEDTIVWASEALEQRCRMAGVPLPVSGRQLLRQAFAQEKDS